MKIASWNVNSLRVRQAHVEDWLRTHQPDVLGLQEIKLVTEAFPYEALEAVGYQAVAHGQKTYNGVALLSREAGESISLDIPDFSDEQRRVIAGTFDGVRVINVYVPNGQSVESDKYQYKLNWLRALHDYVQSELASHPRLLIMGDFNIAPADEDVHDPEGWRDKVLCSGPEREQLENLLELGLVDSFRLFDQPERSYSWWDYRNLAFRRKHGLRIDLLLASKPLADQCTEAGIDIEPRRLERPSDHAPVFAIFG